MTTALIPYVQPDTIEPKDKLMEAKPERRLSIAGQLHELLVDLGAGAAFTSISLQQIAEEKGIEGASHGAVSGFISNARERGMVALDGKRQGNKKQCNLYRVTSQDKWNFHEVLGHGSYPGRTFSTVKKRTLPAEQVEKLPPEVTTEANSLADQLMAIAINVAALEAKGDKTLADFTTDELLAEIKRRMPS